MTRTWLPKGWYMPWRGQYFATYRWHMEDSFAQVPGKKAYATAGQAINAADEYLAAAMSKHIRTEQASSPEPDTLGVEDWHIDRAARAAEAQEKALGGVITRGGKLVAVERMKSA